MEKIGSKIKTIRKAKGLTQEELAEASKVNLRTIQRIENNVSEPRGKTINLICEVLDVNIEDILDFGKQTNTNYLIVFNLSVLAFLIIPVGNIIIPLILWLTKKDKVIGLSEAGINLLNFQILWTILTYVSIALFIFLKVFHLGTYNFLFIIAGSLHIINFVLPIYLAIRIKKANSNVNYPRILNLIK